MLGPRTYASFRRVKDYICEEYPEFGNVILRHCEKCEKDHRKKWRGHAHSMHVKDAVCCCTAMEELSEEQRCGIFAHEFGHLYCGRHPKIYPKNTDDNADKACDAQFGIIIYYDDDDLEVVDLPLGDYLEDGEEEPPDYAERLDRGFFDPKPLSKAEDDRFNGPVVDTEFTDIGM